MIVTIFCGDLPGKLRKAFPRETVLAFAGTKADLATIRAKDDGRPLVLVGYSAGCHEVRNLLAHLSPAAVVTLDGTHRSLTERKRPNTMPVLPWDRLYAKALGGEVVWIASHTYNTYTDQLTEGPFRSTVGTLRDVTGALLPPPLPGRSPTLTRLSSLTIASYTSGPCDKAAHGHQLQVAGEELCRAHLPSVLGSDPVTLPDFIPAVASALAGTWRKLWPFGASLGQALLDEALATLGLKESRPNAGPEIDTWLRSVGAGSPNNWCAAAVSHWLKRAARELGAEPPIAGSAGAKAIMGQLQKAARWVDAKDLRSGKVEMRPGMIVVWHRGKPGDWTGHIGVLERVPVDGVTFSTIEGNSGPTSTEVARMSRRLDDPNLLGMGWVD